MDNKPNGNSQNLVLQVLYVASSIIFYENVRPKVDKVSVRIVEGVVKILGFRRFTDKLKAAENTNDEYDDEEFNDDSLFSD